MLLAMGKKRKKQAQPKQPPTLSPRKQLIFRIVMLAIPVLFFVVLEVSLRLAHYGGNLDLFIPLKGTVHQYKMVNPVVGKRFFFTQSTVPTPNNDVFLAQKPENGLRIFVLGGSTTAGYPYSPNIMFSRVLHFLLKKAYPDRYVEVVNTAMAAINSYSLVDFLDEIFREQPDAILIYAGHNEYYGALGVASYESLGRNPAIIYAYLKLKKWRTFLLVRDGVVKLKQLFARIVGGGQKVDPSATLMERIVAEQQIPYHSKLYYQGLQQFERNISVILKQCKRRKVPVIISEVVSNVRDLEPFIAVKTDSFPPADVVFRQAQRAASQGDWTRAYRLFYRAKDLDALRFRATEELNETIHRLAGQFQIPVVPMKRYFESRSPQQLVGNNLMVDHLHPNIDGYFLMARAFFDTMAKFNIPAKMTADLNLNWYMKQLRRQSYTALDSVYGDIRVRVLKGGWPFRKDRGPNKVLLNFKPANVYEALAFDAWATDKLTIEKAHVKLAERFEKEKKIRDAIAEYQALIHLTPYNASPYLNVARLYIEQQQLKAALPYLLESLKLEPTAYAQKWAGQILLKMGQTRRALKYLQQAARQRPDDVQLLYNLSGAYALTGDYQKAYDTIVKAEKIDPKFPDLQNFKHQLERVLQENNEPQKAS